MLKTVGKCSPTSSEKPRSVAQTPRLWRPHLEGGVLLHVPQQLWLLGRRVVTHGALELLPWKEGRKGERHQVWESSARHRARYTEMPVIGSPESPRGTGK